MIDKCVAAHCCSGATVASSGLGEVEDTFPVVADSYDDRIHIHTMKR